MNWNEQELNKLLSFSFGDNPALADELLGLLLQGKKRATCSALRDYQKSNAEPLPQVGRHDIVLDGSGNRACIIKTTSLEFVRFENVSEDFALAEGEGDFEDWKAGHIAYFSRNGGFDPKMELVCERFEVVHIFSAK